MCSSDLDDAYADSDGDGFGDVAASSQHCAAPSGAVADATDCDDADANVNPGEREVCRNGVDDDCDGTATGCAIESGSTLGGDILITGDSSRAYLGSGEGIGDTDGDGCDDVVCAASGLDEMFVFSGCLMTGRTLPAEAIATIVPDQVTAYGPGGDLDGDGAGDVILELLASGTPDRVAVYLAPLSGTYTEGDADAIFTAEETGDRAFAMSILPDIDGDGVADLLVGAYNAGDGGRAYLFYGGTLADAGLADADAVYDGAEAGDWAGYAVSAGGDVDADGYQDFWVTAANGGMSDYGTSHLILGPGSGSESLAAADAVVSFGSAEQVSGLGDVGPRDPGDVDGDGYSDALMGTSNISARLLYGPLSGNVDLTTRGILLQGEASNFRVYDVSTSDTDANGTADILVSTEGDTTGGYDGLTYLFTTAPTSDLTLADADAVIQGDASAGAAYLANPGDVNGDGFGDVMIGAPLSSFLASEAGVVSIFFGTGL